MNLICIKDFRATVRTKEGSYCDLLEFGCGITYQVANLGRHKVLISETNHFYPIVEDSFEWVNEHFVLNVP